MIKIIQPLIVMSLVCGSLLFLSCDSGEPTDPNNTIIIYLAGENDLGRTWNITGIEETRGIITPQTCLADNNYTYYRNGTYEVNEGASKCKPGDPPALVGTWELDDEDALLTIAIGDSVVVWEIESVNDHNHNISTTFGSDHEVYHFEQSN